MATKTRRHSTNIVVLVFTLLVVGAVSVYLDWTSIYAILIKADSSWFLLSIVVYMLNYLLRAYRFKLLIQSIAVPLRELMGIACLHGMFTYLMPAKTGEFSYLWLIRRYRGVQLTESTASLVVARFFDFAVISLFLPAVLVVFWDRLPQSMMITAAVFCGIVYVVGGGAIIYFRRPTAELIQSSSVQKNAVAVKIIASWRGFVDAVHLIHQRGGYLKLLLLTTAIWLCIYTTFYCVVRSLGFEPTYAQMVVVSIILIPITLLPLQGFANIGTHEMGFVFAFALFGYSHEDALLIAVSSHILLLVLVMLLGAVGFIFLRQDGSSGVKTGEGYGT